MASLVFSLSYLFYPLFFSFLLLHHLLFQVKKKWFACGLCVGPDFTVLQFGECVHTCMHTFAYFVKVHCEQAATSLEAEVFITSHMPVSLF